MDLDAVVLADHPLADVRIAGLSARERAVRVAGRVGARRIQVVDHVEDRAALASWRRNSHGPLLILRADQLVHTPLATPLVEWLVAAPPGADGAAVTVEDLPSGTY